MTDARPRALGVGLLVALFSAVVFGSAGPFAKALIATGWTPGAVVLLRLGIAALLLLPVTLHQLRGHWGLLRQKAGPVLAYGVFAIAGCQLGFFSAVQTLPVGVALLIEYLAPVLIVGWMWARHGQRPDRLTALGVVVSVAGLVLVLDLTGTIKPSVAGVVWALIAAVGLCVYFIVGARADGIPPLALAGAGMCVATALLGVLGLVRLVPMTFRTGDVSVAGVTLPWWAAILELAIVPGVLAYTSGVLAARLLGAVVSSFVGLSEVLFAVLWSWFLLGELPRPVQLAGGVLIVVGIVAVRLAEARRVERWHDPTEGDPLLSSLDAVPEPGPGAPPRQES